MVKNGLSSAAGRLEPSIVPLVERASGAISQIYRSPDRLYNQRIPSPEEKPAGRKLFARSIGRLPK
jgi:hypothetical protein